MDPRAAVQRLLDLHEEGELDIDGLDQHLDDTARQLLSALCTCLSFAVGATRGTGVQSDQAREWMGQCVDAINMIFEVWEMADVEIVDAPYLDEYELGWCLSN